MVLSVGLATSAAKSELTASSPTRLKLSSRAVSVRLVRESAVASASAPSASMAACGTASVRSVVLASSMAPSATPPRFPITFHPSPSRSR